MGLASLFDVLLIKFIFAQFCFFAIRIYLDSNVFISFIKEEIGSRQRGLFIEARDFFDRVKEQKSTLVLSELFFREVEKITYMGVKSILKGLGNINYEFAELEKEDFILSGSLNAHNPDSLHAAIAINRKCDCLVTFNIKDFAQISD